MDTPSGRTYVIRSVRDLFDVPADRLPVCLMELKSWLQRVRADVLMNGLPLSLGPYIWTDDGTSGFTRDPRYLERDALTIGHNYLMGNVNDATPRFRDLSVREQYRRQG